MKNFKINHKNISRLKVRITFEKKKTQKDNNKKFESEKKGEEE